MKIQPKKRKTKFKKIDGELLKVFGVAVPTSGYLKICRKLMVCLRQKCKMVRDLEIKIAEKLAYLRKLDEQKKSKEQT